MPNESKSKVVMINEGFINRTAKEIKELTGVLNEYKSRYPEAINDTAFIYLNNKLVTLENKFNEMKKEHLELQDKFIPKE